LITGAKKRGDIIHIKKGVNRFTHSKD
jgi:hypothetical protein